jgi:PAS domain S-box-containing protein
VGTTIIAHRGLGEDRGEQRPRTPEPRERIGRGRDYATALALSALAIGASFLLRPLLRESIFPLLLGAVFLSTRWGGIAPGILSIVLSGAGAAGFLLDPSDGAASIVMRVGVFGVTGLAISGLTARLEQAAETTRQGEAVLRLRERQLRLLIEHTPAPIAMLDREMRYLATSRRWREDFRLGDADLTGRSHYDVFPEVPDRWKEIHRRCLGGAVERAEEDRFERADGHIDWLRWEVRPWRDEDGSVGGIIIFSEIITAQKEAEHALRKSARELEQRVQERTRDLVETNRELDAFASLAAHDLRAPLRAVQVFAGMIRSTAVERLSTEEREELGRIEAAGTRMDALIQDLLAFSRLRRQDLPLEEVDLGRVFYDILETLGPSLRERNARIEILDSLSSVRADRPSLERAISNLLMNAATYVAKKSRPCIRVRTDRRGNKVRLEIEDNGIGIEKEDQERIFEPLVRLQRQDDYPGTGLGLAIVRRAVERMGGQVGVKSEPGKGSRFWIELSAPTSANQP